MNHIDKELREVVLEVLKQGGSLIGMELAIGAFLHEDVSPRFRLYKSLRLRRWKGRLEAAFLVIEPGDTSIFFTISVEEI
jgi:hypothetical protein